MTIHHPIRGLQYLAIRATLVASIACALVHPAAAAGGDPPIVRVRSTDASLASLIDRAARQSATFQRLIATIERSNGIVQVEAGMCRHGVRACLKMWMETAGATRYLRVVIDRRKDDRDEDVMASMGHELQHAVEGLSESGVTNGRLLFNFFARFAPTEGDRFETTAAIDAGDAVRNELRSRGETSQR
jgi:hypothetical protein